MSYRRIYLAARYSRNDEMRGVRDVLTALGYEVTSRWIGMPITLRWTGDDFTWIPVPAGDSR